VAQSSDLISPFTRAAALAAGLTPNELRGPRFVLLFRGVHARRVDAQNALVRARAALLLHPSGAVLAGPTAATLLGLPTPEHSEVHVCVSRDVDRRSRPGLTSLVDSRPRGIGWVDGTPVVAGTALFLQLAASLDLVDLVIAGDAMVRRGLVTLEGLRGVCATARGKGAGRARRAAALVRERVDSPMETRLRLLLVFAGFPEPLVNPAIAGRYRADLCWPQLRLVLEYDGRQHRDDLDQWDSDIERNAWFERHDWVLVHVVARDIFTRPDELLERVHADWVRRGGRPFRLRPDWRPHFAVRAHASGAA
jgi:hypothetical protein